MAIRLRCSDCDRDVLVDEAFAGGMCRCPHCKATLSVPDREPGRSGNRPAQPDAEPAAPAEAPVARRHPRPYAHGPSPHTHHLRRLVIVLLVGLGLVFIAAGGVAIHRQLTARPEQGESRAVDPFAAMRSSEGQPSGPAIADVPLQGKVVYVLDSGASMKNLYDYAVALTLRSVETLGGEQRYSVVLAGEDEPRTMDGGYRPPDRQPEAFLAGTVPGGATDIAAALAAAAEMQPDVVVLMSRKGVDDPAAARPVREAGGRLVTIALEADKDAEASLAAAAASAGGESRSYSRGQLDRWLARRP
jgi:hypothetical protein